MTQHLGKPIPSSALMEHIGTRFPRAVESYASPNGIPWVRFGKDDRKIDVMQPHIVAQAATGRSGVAAIGVLQEFRRVWSAYQRDTKAAAPQYTFATAGRRVTCCYFYLRDEGLRPGVPQGLRLLPLSGQDLGQRARAGQVAGAQGRHRVHGAAQRVRVLR